MSSPPKESNSAGQNWAFAAVDGQPMRGWRSGNLTLRREYDTLRRPVQTWANEGSGEALKELMVYGELSGANPTGSFHLGQLVRVYDGAGLLEMVYDFKGQVIQQTRTILDDPEDELDWADLETETSISGLDSATPSGQLSSASANIFEQEVDYDALGRPTDKRLPDVTVHGRSSLSYGYDEGGRLFSVSLASVSLTFRTVFNNEMDFQIQPSRLIGHRLGQGKPAGLFRSQHQGIRRRALDRPRANR